MEINICLKMTFSYIFEFYPHHSMACTILLVGNIFHTSTKNEQGISEGSFQTIHWEESLEVKHNKVKYEEARGILPGTPLLVLN